MGRQNNHPNAIFIQNYITFLERGFRFFNRSASLVSSKLDRKWRERGSLRQPDFSLLSIYYFSKDTKE